MPSSQFSLQGFQVAAGIFGGVIGFFAAIFYLPMHWNIVGSIAVVALAIRMIVKPFHPRLSS